MPIYIPFGSTSFKNRKLTSKASKFEDYASGGNALDDLQEGAEPFFFNGKKEQNHGNINNTRFK